MQVGPGFLLLARVAQQIGRVVGDDELRSAEGVDAAAQACQWLALAQQIGCGGGAEGDDDLRTDNFNLAEEKRRAGVGFVRLRRAVLRRAAFDHVGDVDFFALEAHGADHVVEQLAGAAYERQALRILVGAGTFANKHEAGAGRAIGKDQFVAPGVESAASAVADFFAENLQRGIAIGGGDGRSGGGRRNGNGLAGRNGSVLLYGLGGRRSGEWRFFDRRGRGSFSRRETREQCGVDRAAIELSEAEVAIEAQTRRDGLLR